MEEISLSTLKCLRCGYSWHPRTEKRPGVCPRCKSYKWDVDKSEVKK